MPNRNDMECVPEGRWARARWAEANLDRILENIPFHCGWEGLSTFEAKLFPTSRKGVQLQLDPTCPTCGIETEMGTVERDGESFLVRREGRWVATPLLVVLLVVAMTDVMFALDSIPAVLSVTRDPFIVWTSNVAAILGLRALFFLIERVLTYFRYLRIGLAIVLGFVGVKMLSSDVYEMPIALSLGVVAGILSVSMLASYIATLREARSAAKALTSPSPSSPDATEGE